MRLISALVILTAIIGMGCSGGMSNTPVFPGDLTSGNSVPGNSSHGLWGLWQVTADPDAGTLEISRMRTSEVHVNVIPFLETSAGSKLSISNLSFDDLLCDVDVTLTHPFPGMSQYTGFDVAGIFISAAENQITLMEPELSLAGEGDTRLLNADGYTRWWNPAEFSIPGPGIMRYRDGKLGNPHESANYNCTLNPYKVFGDDLDVESDVLDLGPTHRNEFTPGASNTRHYTIDFSGGVVFNYAVDANWEEPEGSEPYDIDDFPSSANRAEPWAISVTVDENSLYNNGAGDAGGDFEIVVEFWDHYNPEQVSWYVFEPESGWSSDGGLEDVGDGFGICVRISSEGEVEPPADSVDLYFVFNCEVRGYWDVLENEDVIACFKYTLPVGSETPEFEVTDPNGGEQIPWDTNYDILWDGPGAVGAVDLYYSKDDFVSDINLIEADFPNGGMYNWLVPADESTTVKVRVEEAGGGMSDESDEYFEIYDPGCEFIGSPFTLEEDYNIVPGVWSHNGILCTGQDETQRIIGRSWPGEGGGGIIKIFNADDPMYGAVATYDTGDLIYCNNDQAMWLDKFSEPGIDRIIYNNFGSGSPTAGYQLQTIDWDGSTFSNHQTLPKSGSIWSLCTTPEGDIILHNAQSVSPSFFYYDKSAGYSWTFMFTLQQATCDFGSVGNIREMIYDPELDCLLLFCNNQAVSLGGQLFAIDMDGNLVDEDREVFPIEAPNKMAFRVGIDIDLESPYCRVILYGGEDNQANETQKWHFARYSSELDEKENYEDDAPVYYGPCRGDLDNEGNLWASPHTGYAHFYKMSPPTDW